MIKDFGCDRNHYIALWKRNPDSLCVSFKNMNKMIMVENLSIQLMQQYGFNLNSMSTHAALVYIHIDDEKLKQRVLQKMKTAIETGTNPITGEKFGTFGLTAPLMKTLVRLERRRMPKSS